MDICHAHNLPVDSARRAERRFGIRVSLPPGDTFRRLVGDDWETTHWFATREERDAEMADMARRHRYSRIGDDPRIILQAVDR
jgi:hypothetical protein